MDTSMYIISALVIAIAFYGLGLERGKKLPKSDDSPTWEEVDNATKPLMKKKTITVNIPADDSTIERPTDAIWAAICKVESSNNPNAVNGDAVGIAQIRPICLYDCNRIAKHTYWYPDNRFDPILSRDMFELYANHYSDGSDEDRARVWFGGPDRLNSDRYWEKVRKAME